MIGSIRQQCGQQCVHKSVKIAAIITVWRKIITYIDPIDPQQWTRAFCQASIIRVRAGERVKDGGGTM